MKLTKQMRQCFALLLSALLLMTLLGGCGAQVREESSAETGALQAVLPEEKDEEQPDRDPSAAAEENTDAPEQKEHPPAEPPQEKTDSGKSEETTAAAEKPKPAEPQEAQAGEARNTCTISISCATILDNLDRCDGEKAELVPEDGWILQPTEVEFYEGESVFNVLQRTCKQRKIHMEYSNTPIYNSAYIEGIHNLYEFDVGELSGWMYSVNGWFPNYGCSRYQVQRGDVICWVYTCDLGADVGGSESAQKDE